MSRPSSFTLCPVGHSRPLLSPHFGPTVPCRFLRPSSGSSHCPSPTAPALRPSIPGPSESLPHRYQPRAPPLCLANGTLHSLGPTPVGPAPHCPYLRPRPSRPRRLRLRPSSSNGRHKLGTRRPRPASALIGGRQCRGREAERREAEQDGRHLARSRSRNRRLWPRVHTSPRPSAATAQPEPLSRRLFVSGPVPGPVPARSPDPQPGPVWPPRGVTRPPRGR